MSPRAIPRPAAPGASGRRAATRRATAPGDEARLHPPQGTPDDTRAALALGAAAAGAALLLLLLGGDLLALPGPAGAAGWVSETEPSVVAMAVVRAIALALCWYVVAACGCVLGARAAGRSLTLARLVPGTMVRLSAGAAVSGLVAAAAASAVAPAPDRPTSTLAGESADPVAPPAPTDPTTTARPAIDASTTTVFPTITAAPATDPAPPTMLAPGPATESDLDPAPDLDPTPEPLAAPPTLEPVDPSPTPPPAPDAGTEPSALETWTIAPGDHLWAVAEETLVDRWDRTPSEREVTRYWQALVEHNRSRLVDPDNPDLVYAGQVVELPDAGTGS